MNFYGHVFVGRRESLDPGFLFGTMVPDFAGMLRLRVVDGLPETVERGIAHHHRTDDVFHRAPVFVALAEELTGELEGLGVGRGPSRAVGHIGTELLLDGLLPETGEVGGLFERALRFGRGFSDPAFDGRLRHPRALDHLPPLARLGALSQHLLTEDLPLAYRETEQVTTRLMRALASRPRLALREEDAPSLRRALPVHRERVAARLDELVAYVEGRMAAVSAVEI